ncbi:hypothetical protein [Nannocystis radixulma]|uniref:Uncharacterized protein n=1 Tax=Nannocystis radixulma TaxID=2995305 RepID=A0ABT5BNU9_9BACT|nr:hypothetical protein [Nannocystis radixulma]MDC0675844.1 hypothetical protein [Nannocystis radixulma]
MCAIRASCDQSAGGCGIAFCDINDLQCTGEGAQCTSCSGELGEEPPPSFADVGICVIPG